MFRASVYNTTEYLKIKSSVLVLGVKLVAHIQLRLKLLLKLVQTELQRVHVFLMSNIRVLCIHTLFVLLNFYT